MKIKICVRIFMLICMTLVLVGCEPSFEPVTWMEECLKNQIGPHDILVFQPNPMYEYPVVVSEELLTVLDMGAWEEGTPNYGTTIAMVYCDVSDDQRAYRLAIFSNGDILLQEYKDGFLSNGEERWYYCSTKPNGQVFEDLLDLIDSQSLNTTE